MNRYFLSLGLSLTLYAFLSLSYYGWGRVTTYLLRLNERAIENKITLIWLGWAITLFIFQILHCFLPITALVVAPVLVAGVFFASPDMVNAILFSARKPAIIFKFSGILLVCLVPMAWIASRAMLGPNSYDSGLYYLNTIRWINSFPIVPGLGNLHGRLAFNQSFFTYAATLNFYPYFKYGWSIANSFLFILTGLTFTSYLWPVLRKPSLLFNSHPFQFLPALFALPILGYNALTTGVLSSPAPDLASALLQIIIFVTLLQFIEAWVSGKHPQHFRASLLAVLAATEITIKLSNVVFVAVILVIVLAYELFAVKRSLRELIRLLILPIAILALWCWRGVLLSGAPLYPLTFGYLPVDWAVPKSSAINEANWIYSWARQPNKQWNEVLGNWDWLIPWWTRISKDLSGIVYPLTLAAVMSPLIIGIFIFQPPRHRWRLELSIIASPTLALIFWFFTAPDPRFATDLLLLMPVAMILIVLVYIRSIVSSRVYPFLILLFFVAANLQIASYGFDHRATLKVISTSGYRPAQHTLLIKKATQSGLVIYVPATGDQCWDAPLPCTPYFNASLRLRDPTRLGSGFTVARQRVVESP